MIKKIAPKKASNDILSDIKNLHACIAKDQNTLDKLYKKAIVESSKKLIALRKESVKAKKAVVQATKNKKKSPKNYLAAVALAQSLKSEQSAEKATLVILKTESKNFNAQQKALDQINKQLAKSTKKSANPKKKKLKLKKQKTDQTTAVPDPKNSPTAS